jgi:hypothetical protein
MMMISSSSSVKKKTVHSKSHLASLKKREKNNKCTTPAGGTFKAGHSTSPLASYTEWPIADSPNPAFRQNSHLCVRVWCVCLKERERERERERD